MNPKVAILVVNGGEDPPYGKWLKFCLNKILENTKYSNYHIYVWNNNTEDIALAMWCDQIDQVSLYQPESNDELLSLRDSNIHAASLQRLYERAKQDGATIIVTMDTDAHPCRSGWLQTLLRELGGDTVLVGVWRDELKKAISPYVHASCLCTTTNFIEQNGLRLDCIPPSADGKLYDTLSFFTDRATSVGKRVSPLLRSNKRNFHRLLGGIYGGVIYHHGAGSRSRISFWDEKPTEENVKKNAKIVEETTKLLFEQYQGYIGWLEGKPASITFRSKMQKIKYTSIFILDTKRKVCWRAVKTVLRTVPPLYNCLSSFRNKMRELVSKPKY